jgi:hypothetical protein
MAVRLKLLLRVCAVGSSLLLVAAFVVYRAGAVSWLIHLESAAVAASDPAATESAGESTPEKPADEPVRMRPAFPEDDVIFGGSKSGIVTSRMRTKPARPARPSAGEPARETAAPKEKTATPTPRPNE